jgi:ADP-heptose:LPS heptosyltransferase
MNLLVIRMSAMGDVALTIPAIRSVLDQYPRLHITVATRKQFLPFFADTERLSCITADVKGRHKGIRGLYRLYQEIKHQYPPDAVIDLHDVLRSRVLSFFFKSSSIPVFSIDKGRKEKAQLTAKEHKQHRQLTHTVTRYLNVFKDAGFPATLSGRTHWFSHTDFPRSFLEKHNVWPKSVPWIGIAPFAKHREKRWPLEKMEQVMKVLDQKNMPMFLFGGAEDLPVLNDMKKKYVHSVVVAGALSLTEELGLIRELDVMVSMDSANMHLAALSGIPVVSVWGATHPYAGFGPLNDNEKYIVQIPAAQLSCRPCSVFGNKPCFRGDHACMEWIRPEEVIGMIQKALEQ